MIPVSRWQEALDIQDASNLSGLVHSFPQILDDIWTEAREKGLGTEFVNTHPLVILWLDKLNSLARIQFYGDEELNRIHGAFNTAYAMTRTP